MSPIVCFVTQRETSGSCKANDHIPSIIHSTKPNVVQKELDDLGHGERMLKHQQRSSEEVRVSATTSKGIGVLSGTTLILTYFNPQHTNERTHWSAASTDGKNAHASAQGGQNARRKAAKRSRAGGQENIGWQEAHTTT